LGLAAEFHAEFGQLLDRLSQTPFIYPVLYRDVRRAVLRRFPYLVWYRVQGSDIVVLACTHGKLDPVRASVRLG
jgi:plasmid stabilization system protein ParE